MDGVSEMGWGGGCGCKDACVWTWVFGMGCVVGMCGNVCVGGGEVSMVM